MIPSLLPKATFPLMEVKVQIQQLSMEEITQSKTDMVMILYSFCPVPIKSLQVQLVM